MNINCTSEYSYITVILKCMKLQSASVSVCVISPQSEEKERTRQWCIADKLQIMWSPTHSCSLQMTSSLSPPSPHTSLAVVSPLWHHQTIWHHSEGPKCFKDGEEATIFVQVRGSECSDWLLASVNVQKCNNISLWTVWFCMNYGYSVIYWISWSFI